jgi:hypothetical protein
MLTQIQRARLARDQFLVYPLTKTFNVGSVYQELAAVL